MEFKRSIMSDQIWTTCPKYIKVVITWIFNERESLNGYKWVSQHEQPSPVSLSFVVILLTQVNTKHIFRTISPFARVKNNKPLQGSVWFWSLPRVPSSNVPSRSITNISIQLGPYHFHLVDCNKSEHSLVLHINKILHLPKDICFSFKSIARSKL